jgi:N-acetylmuramoyl-L-alanine amidase
VTARQIVLLFLVVGVAVSFGAKPKSKAKKGKPAKKQSRVEQVKKDQARVARDWYNSLQESLTSLPADAVKGRTIVIDPGHTNCSPGAEGPKKRIIEADLNWQVASRLGKLLTAAGARVVLTKEYGPPKPLDLRNTEADLDGRVAVSNRERADLFISVHHNWTNDPAVNRTEVYYRLEDLGASRDAANYVLIHLTRNVGLDGELLPANFRVLRINKRPAMLTEASYMSNPLQESLLAITSKQELEAQAIYLGVLDYFSHGVPEFTLLTSIADIAPLSLPQLRIRVGGPADIDRSTIRAWLDGGPTNFEYFAKDRTCVISPLKRLANGPHRLHFEARNVKGNAGIPLDTNFITDREPARIALVASPPVCPPDHTVMEIRATAYDRDGQVVADTRHISFTADRVAMGDSMPHGGSARFYLSRNQAGSVRVTARCGSALASLTAVFAASRSALAQFRILGKKGDNYPFSSEEKGLVVPLFPPIPGAVVTDDWRTDSSLANDDGIVTLSPIPGGHRFRFTAPGFRPAEADVQVDSHSVITRDIRLEPLLGGTLIGARVMLDPAGNWEQPDTSGELFAFNMALVRQAATLFERSGAATEIAVSVNKKGDRAESRIPNPESRILPRTKTERLFRAGEFKPDYYIKVSTQPRSSASRATVGHYPSSATGTAAAEAIGARLRRIPELNGVETVSEQSYEIVQAPSPAVGVYFRLSGAGPAADSTLAGDLAREILLGLASQRGASAPCRVSLRATTAQSKPVPGARITIDDLLTYATDARGELNIPGLEPGRHSITVQSAGYATVLDQMELSAAIPTLVKTITLRFKTGKSE